jgi:hypothetical protein
MAESSLLCIFVLIREAAGATPHLGLTVLVSILYELPDGFIPRQRFAGNRGADLIREILGDRRVRLRIKLGA